MIVPARFAHGNGGAETFGGTGGVDHPAIGAVGQLLRQELGSDSCFFDQTHLVAMPAEQVDARAVRLQNLRYQKP
jgi:hypothetical protein